jgi:hypothetical protein
MSICLLYSDTVHSVVYSDYQPGLSHSHNSQNRKNFNLLINEDLDGKPKDIVIYSSYKHFTPHPPSHLLLYFQARRFIQGDDTHIISSFAEEFYLSHGLNTYTDTKKFASFSLGLQELSGI